MKGKWGILVAIGKATIEGEPPGTEIDEQDTIGRPSAMEQGAPLLFALGSVWKELISEPFLYLITPLGARRHILEGGQDGKCGLHRVGENHSSVEAARREHERCGKGIRLVLVHLDSPTRFLHPGLLPWLGRFAPDFAPDNKNTLSITELLRACLDPSRDDAVFVATVAPGEVHDWLQSPWMDLMRFLEHKE